VVTCIRASYPHLQISLLRGGRWTAIGR